ncbi:MAG: alcohol dehydrogenase [Micrococcales bacterium 73-13]|nr:MAG: alcohol dehydrogenase [Micrococcales bacterium 73-13]
MAEPKVATGPNTRLQSPVARAIGGSDLIVHPLALGGNVFGWLVDDAQARRILDVYADAGGMLVDTADSYAGGRSETIIGSWMAAKGIRDRLVVSTKVGKSPDHPGLSPRSVISAVEASLQRLRVETIDLLFLHIDDQETPFEETLLAVDRLIREGKVRRFGGSDHHGNRLVEARIACGMMGVAPMVALQNEYNLLRRAGYERGLRPVVESLGLGMMPRFALAGGFLSGEYRSREDLRRARHGRGLGAYLDKRGLRILSALEAVAEEQDVAMATVAVAWLLTRPEVVAPVVSVTSPEQLREILAAPMIGLTRQQVAALDEVSAWK